MLDNITYNKAKLLHEISSICWFIDHHALKDAREAGNEEWFEDLKKLRADLELHLKKLQCVECTCQNCPGH